MSTTGRLLAVTPDGVFAGYAALFSKPDLGNDVIEPGAFRASIRARGGAEGLRVLFMHDPKEPIGVLTDIAEDQRGLLVRGRLTPGVKRAHEVYALLKAGALDGLSIGFKPVTARRDPRTGVRRLVTVDLWEVSLVTFPLMPGARVFRMPALPALDAKYSPDQPRVPKGEPGGGQWTADGTGTPRGKRNEDDEPRSAKEEGREEETAGRPGGPRKPPGGPPSRPPARPPNIPQRDEPRSAPPREPPTASPPREAPPNPTPATRPEPQRGPDQSRDRDPTPSVPVVPAIPNERPDPIARQDDEYWRHYHDTRPTDYETRIQRTVDEIIAPEGRPLGWRNEGAGAEILTVTPEMFEALRDDLKEGAESVPRGEREGSLGGYPGEVFRRRTNAEMFGIRISRYSGETIDLFFREDDGYTITKIHQPSGSRSKR